jgi:hypothetical protein
MTKKERIWIVVSVVWLIVVFLVAIDSSSHTDAINTIQAELGLERRVRVFDFAEFLEKFTIAGVLPNIVGWGVWWIRRA